MTHPKIHEHFALTRFARNGWLLDKPDQVHPHFVQRQCSPLLTQQNCILIPN